METNHGREAYKKDETKYRICTLVACYVQNIRIHANMYPWYNFLKTFQEKHHGLEAYKNGKTKYRIHRLHAIMLQSIRIHASNYIIMCFEFFMIFREENNGRKYFPLLFTAIIFFTEFRAVNIITSLLFNGKNIFFYHSPRGIS